MSATRGLATPLILTTSQLLKPRCSTRVSARVFDIQDASAGSSNGPSCKESICTSAAELEAAMPAAPGTCIKIISLHSYGSPMPVLVTDEVLNKIQSYYCVDASFQHVLAAFGSEPYASEGGYSKIVTLQEGDGESGYCSYRLQYVEDNGREGVDPWSLRHTGIYHSYTRDFHFFLFIHPTIDGGFEQQLARLVDRPTQSKELLLQTVACPFTIHTLLLSSYLDNWRRPLRDFDRQIQRKSDNILGLDAQDLQKRPLLEDFNNLHDLRHLNNRISHAFALCSGNAGLIEDLSALTRQVCPTKASASTAFYKALRDRVCGYTKGFETLQASCSASISLSSHAMDWKYQHNAETTNEILLRLTQHTAEDSAIVKTITILSLFYLPGSFMATLYGANFFYFDDIAQQLVLGRNIWILLVSWIALSALTAAFFVLILRRNRIRTKVSSTPVHDEGGDIEGGKVTKGGGVYQAGESHSRRWRQWLSLLKEVRGLFTFKAEIYRVKDMLPTLEPNGKQS